MSILDYTTTREEWLDGILMKSNSFNSQNAHRHAIKKWDEFLESIDQTDAQVLKDLKNKSTEPDAYLFLNRYVLYLSKLKLKRSTIDLYFAALRSWCASNGIMLFNEYVKRFVKFPKENRELKETLTIDIVRELVRQGSRRTRAILLSLLCSGMRIGELLQVKVRDINQETTPIQIKLRAETTKTRESRIAYLSKEAWFEVQELIKNKEHDDFVFVEKHTKYSLLSFEMQFSRLRSKCGFLEKYEDGRNYHVNIHSFRAFFHTQATKVLGGDIAHALLGHHKYLDQYFRLGKNERDELYRTLEPYVTLSNEMRQKAIIDEKDRQLNEMNDMKREILELKAFKKRQEKRTQV